MIRLFAALGIVLCSSVCKCQPYFQRTYGTQQHEQVSSISPSDNGYLLSAANGYDNNTFLIRIDSDGNNLWQKKYFSSGINYLQKIVGTVTTQHGYIVVMNTFDRAPEPLSTYSEVNVVKIDTMGNVAWSTSFTSNELDVPGAIAGGVSTTSDGGIIIAGNEWYMGSYMARRCLQN